MALVFALCAPALLAACLSVRTPSAGAPVQVAAGEGVAFGRIRTFDRGHEITPWKREALEIFAEDPEVELALFHVESGRKRPDVPISSEGRFEWVLPAGTYLLYHTPSTEPPFNEPLAAFQVEASPEATDLGELDLGISVDRPLSSSLATYTLLGVSARAGDDESAALFQRRHPGSSAVRQGAFVVDPDLGALFSNWSREGCARILARHGVQLRPDGSR